MCRPQAGDPPPDKHSVLCESLCEIASEDSAHSLPSLNVLSGHAADRARFRVDGDRLRRMAADEAMNTVEYVPAQMPTSIVNANPRSVSPPKTKSAMTERNVVPAVITVRDRV